MQNSNKQLIGQKFWLRMDNLIGDEEPYVWVERIGINKSAFQSARRRGSRPKLATLQEWAQKIGCDVNWLAYGDAKSEAIQQEKAMPAEEVQLPEAALNKLEILEKTTAKIAALDIEIELKSALRDIVYAIDTGNLALLDFSISQLLQQYPKK